VTFFPFATKALKHKTTQKKLQFIATYWLSTSYHLFV